MTAPGAAADELERAVTELHFKGALINGMTMEKFLDDPFFSPILQRAEQLQAPVYLHPGLPPKQVAEVYYSDLPKSAGDLLSIAGWGWHAETALHILRLIVSGTLDKFPKLQLIIGHMGEMLPMMMVRCDHQFKPGEAGANARSIIETLKSQVHITTSGIFTLPPLMTAIQTFGIDNIMFSVDYPFSTNEEGARFLKSLPFDEKDLQKIAYENAERLLRL
jgi:predicted TIM-barrel fold metal-dependent hydrolase